jgi:hypothetical protein
VRLLNLILHGKLGNICIFFMTLSFVLRQEYLNLHFNEIGFKLELKFEARKHYITFYYQ